MTPQKPKEPTCESQLETGGALSLHPKPIMAKMQPLSPNQQEWQNKAVNIQVNTMCVAQAGT